MGERNRRGPAAGALAVAALCLGWGSNAGAQAENTGYTRADVSAFAAGSRVATDYNSTDYGFTAGADYTRFFKHFAPSVEARYTYSTGSVVSEDSFTGGLRVQTSYRRFTPYADFLGGYGKISFAHSGIPGYNSDNSFIYSFGGGVDYRLDRRWSVRADAQLQHWKLGDEAPAFEPSTLSLGLSYRFFGGFASHPRTPKH